MLNHEALHCNFDCNFHFDYLRSRAGVCGGVGKGVNVVLGINSMSRWEKIPPLRTFKKNTKRTSGFIPDRRLIPIGTLPYVQSSGLWKSESSWLSADNYRSLILPFGSQNILLIDGTIISSESLVGYSVNSLMDIGLNVNFVQQIF